MRAEATIKARAHSALACQHATAEMRLRPLAEVQSLWSGFAAQAPGALLYHREPWLDLLRRAFGLELWVATFESGGELRAACVLAQSKRPFRPRLIALPFSDMAPPLALERSAMLALLGNLSALGGRGGYEIRGLAVPEPWQVASCFSLWMLNLERPAPALERALGENFRRNLRRAARAGVRVERGRQVAHLERFYALHLQARRRLGLPAQPARFFKLLGELFAPAELLEVWIASHGSRDAAALVMLRDGDRLYYKWGARASAGMAGASQLLFWSVLEEFAGRLRLLDLGRTDTRNLGLSRFKHELGGRPVALPYSFFPHQPRQVSAEALSGGRRLLSRLWRHLPLPATRLLSAAVYEYLA